MKLKEVVGLVPALKFGSGDEVYAWYTLMKAHEEGVSAAEAWWIHRPQATGSKPDSDLTRLIYVCVSLESCIGVWKIPCNL